MSVRRIGVHPGWIEGQDFSGHVLITPKNYQISKVINNLSTIQGNQSIGENDRGLQCEPYGCFKMGKKLLWGLGFCFLNRVC